MAPTHPSPTDLQVYFLTSVGPAAALAPNPEEIDLDDLEGDMPGPDAEVPDDVVSNGMILHQMPSRAFPSLDGMNEDAAGDDAGPPNDVVGGSDWT